MIRQAATDRGAGRPAYVATADDRAKVAQLLGVGAPVSDVAKLLGISEPTLRKYFHEDIFSAKKSGKSGRKKMGVAASSGAERARCPTCGQPTEGE